MSPAIGIGAFFAFIILLYVVQGVAGAIRTIAAEAQREAGRREADLQRRIEAEARGRARQQPRRGPVAAVPPRPARPPRVAGDRRIQMSADLGDDGDHGGRLDSHHLEGGLQAHHLRSHVGESAEARHLAHELPESDDALAVPSYSTAPRARSVDPLASRSGSLGLAKLEGLPLAARGFVLSEVFGQPRGRIRPKLLGVRAVDSGS